MDEIIPPRPLPEGRWVSVTDTDDIGIAAADVAAGVAVRLAWPIRSMMVECSTDPRIIDVYHGELTGEIRYLDDEPGGPRVAEAEVRPPSPPFDGVRTVWVLLEALEIVVDTSWVENPKQRRRREAGTRD